MKIYRVYGEDIKEAKKRIRREIDFQCISTLYHYQLTPKIKKYLADFVTHQFQRNLDLILKEIK